MHRSLRLRRVRLVGPALAVALVATVLNASPAGASPVSATPSSTSVVSPGEYFTTQWNDPLDFSNPEDMQTTLLNFPEGSASYGSGVINVQSAGQIFLSRHDTGGIPTSTLRDPRIRELDGDLYTRLSFRMYSDRTAAAAVGYHSCDGCPDGFRYFNIVLGWHTYDLDMVGTSDLEPPPGGVGRNGGAAWGGNIGLLYLAIAFNTPTKPNVVLDDVRLLAPSPAITVTT